MYKYMSRDGMTYQFIGLNIFIPNFQYGWNCFNLGRCLNELGPELQIPGKWV